ncbi:Alpha/Beta hydrolase protein [Cantharellus anzutake]|nr:Alpha/Beta hydrolase protein [Cantharellus anzutake]KAF8330047.1 Alpha/Beta hydrolase protein [Cantharellus anzutake]
MPDGDPASPPPSCPQSSVDSSQYSEDCLFLILYVPVAAAASGNGLNTFAWIHGGSFYYGAATNPGLDGSTFALSTGSIVVTLQYRLGVLGFIPPHSQNGGINLGVKDVTTALSFLRSVLPSFHGNPDGITVAGQSSGGMMVRALMAAPTAAKLFKNGIIQSDPMDFNFLPISAYNILQSWFYSKLPCSPATCPTSQLLSTQSYLLGNASTISPAAGSAEPIRPSVDGQFITTSLSRNSYPSLLKPLLVTTVMDEAGFLIGETLPLGFPEQNYVPIVQATFGNRTATILASPWYNVSSMKVVPGQPDDRTRETLSVLGSDATWRCPSWSFARSYAARGGNVYVGLFRRGATYAGNDASDFCTVGGRVCHQDDIYITFGTTPSPTPDQQTLTAEIQARWGAFVKTSNPNPSNANLGEWCATTSTAVKAIQFGLGGGIAAEDACRRSFWGNAVLFDWQIYGV